MAGHSSAGVTDFLSNKNTANYDTFLRRSVVVHVLMENFQETSLLSVCRSRIITLSKSLILTISKTGGTLFSHLLFIAKVLQSQKCSRKCHYSLIKK